MVCSRRFEDGRGERIRTSDPLVPNQVRYQTALRPELSLRVLREMTTQEKGSGRRVDSGRLASSEMRIAEKVGSGVGEVCWAGVCRCAN